MNLNTIDGTHIIVAFSLYILAFSLNTIYGQTPEENPHVKIFKLIHDGKEYTIPYVMTNGNITKITVNDYGGLLLNLDTNDKPGFAELAIPFGLYKFTGNFAISSPKFEQLFVLEDGEEMKNEIFAIGSKGTYSFDLRPQSEEVELLGTSMAAGVHELIIDTPTEWYDPGSDIVIKGKYTVGGFIQRNATILVEIHDPQNNLVVSNSKLTDENGRFFLATKIPSMVNGGVYKASASLQAGGTSASGQPIGNEFFYVRGPSNYKLIAEDKDSNFSISSNSSSYEPFFMKKSKTLALLVNGKDGTTGQMELLIPHSMLDGDLKAYINTQFNYSLQKNTTHSIINLDYSHKDSPLVIEITGTTIIPEFPIVILALVASMVIILIISRTKMNKI
ncbi:MAG: PEFG-CTERM sorting domain-containing protein [Nitrosopumilaceae archaeon]